MWCKLRLLAGAETGAEMIPFTACTVCFTTTRQLEPRLLPRPVQGYIADTVFPFPLRGAEITSVGGAVGKHMPVGSRTGAVFRRSSLAIAPRFLWECLSSQTVNPFPAPTTWRGVPKV